MFPLKVFSCINQLRVNLFFFFVLWIDFCEMFFCKPWCTAAHKTFVERRLLAVFCVKPFWGPVPKRKILIPNFLRVSIVDHYSTPEVCNNLLLALFTGQVFRKFDSARIKKSRLHKNFASRNLLFGACTIFMRAVPKQFLSCKWTFILLTNLVSFKTAVLHASEDSFF